MMHNGDAVLERYLAKHKQARHVWQIYRKLEHDPRVTSIGKWLRQSKIDELPQLWNIVRGDMVWVGARQTQTGV